MSHSPSRASPKFPKWDNRSPTGMVSWQPPLAPCGCGEEGWIKVKLPLSGSCILQGFFGIDPEERMPSRGHPEAPSSLLSNFFSCFDSRSSPTALCSWQALIPHSCAPLARLTTGLPEIPFVSLDENVSHLIQDVVTKSDSLFEES
jgi:hypothetical protein